MYNTNNNNNNNMFTEHVKYFVKMEFSEPYDQLLILIMGVGVGGS